MQVHPETDPDDPLVKKFGIMIPATPTPSSEKSMEKIKGRRDSTASRYSNVLGKDGLLSPMGSGSSSGMRRKASSSAMSEDMV
jgi:hypothetical protein